MTQVEDIKTRLDIVDILSEYIQLKPAGSSHKALCPFHTEKSPSFMVSRDRQAWHCFGCGEGGDIFSFVQKIEGLDFSGALKLLAQKAGVKLSYERGESGEQKDRILKILDFTAKYWHKVLLEDPRAEAARKYLEKRKVTQTSIEEFMLGYAPDSWDATLNILKQRGFLEKDIFLAGLILKKERGSSFYDRFRNRVIFPVTDQHGNVIAFGGRTLSSTETAKYINSPQTPVYNKSQAVYNLYRAKQQIKKENLAVAVEGYMDALSCWQAGTKNVVAISGTAMTPEHIKILSRFTQNIALAFDADSAGENAALRAIELSRGTEVNMKVIVVPQGKDPDECVSISPKLWLEAVSQPRSIIEYSFEQALKKTSPETVEGKKALAKNLLLVISKISNRIEQTHWLQRLSGLINVPEEILRESIPGNTPASRKPQETIETSRRPETNRQQMIEERLLATIFKFSEHLGYVIDNLEHKFVYTEHLSDIYKNLVIYYTEHINNQENTSFRYSDFSDFLANAEGYSEKNLRQHADVLHLLGEKEFFDFEPIKVRGELQTLVRSLKRSFFSRELTKIQQNLAHAELNNDDPEIQRLSQYFSTITKELQLLDL